MLQQVGTEICRPSGKQRHQTFERRLAPKRDRLTRLRGYLRMDRHRLCDGIDAVHEAQENHQPCPYDPELTDLWSEHKYDWPQRIARADRTQPRSPVDLANALARIPAAAVRTNHPDAVVELTESWMAKGDGFGSTGSHSGRSMCCVR